MAKTNTTVNPTTEIIKTDLICLVQRNYLKNKANQQYLAELAERNEKAERYSKSVQSRHRNFLAKICKGVALIVSAVAVSAVCIVASGKTEPRYAIPSEQANGFHYVYITERICTVTEITGDYVTVEYNGNLYDFFGYGYSIGETITCQFTDGMEIVGVVE
jgi:hypothetical protein